MSSKHSPCVIGIDVGGTNTDSVILQDNKVLAWYKTPSTSDIQTGVEDAIQGVMRKVKTHFGVVGSVRIGTTQFVNAVLEQDSSKLDKVAVIRLCGRYSRSVPPPLGFPPGMRNLMEGHFGYTDGGFQVDGTPISELNIDQLKEQASIIRAKSIRSIVIVGIYSPSNPSQEDLARAVLGAELGPDYDISCSHSIGRLGFLERENAAIINASLRRFARHVTAGLAQATLKIGKPELYVTLNDGTLSTASTATEYPVRCFSSGPTNSARGAALLAKWEGILNSDEKEVLVVDVGGTTTDICALLKTGYPRQSASFVKIAGVRTNFTIPDVQSIALGGGSLIRVHESGEIAVGPDSVGSKLETESIAFGGHILTAMDLALTNDRTNEFVSSEVKSSGLRKIQQAVEEGIDRAKTKKGDAKVILVGGGSNIIGDVIAGVGEVVRPKYFEVANAVGAATGKISGIVDTVVVAGPNNIDQEIEAAKRLATEKCVAAGGNQNTVEVIEVEILPISYVTNGAMRVVVRAAGDLAEARQQSENMQASFQGKETCNVPRALPRSTIKTSTIASGDPEESANGIIQHDDLESYRPKIEGNIWYLSEIDLNFLLDGAGILAVGSCGESYPSYLACLRALRDGRELKVQKQGSVADDAIVLVAGFMGSPDVYLERVSGTEEVTDAMRGVINASRLSSFDYIIPNEIGGLNAFEALLAASRSNKSVLDTDCVARAYPMVWQTVPCLSGSSVAPSAVADGNGRLEVFTTAADNYAAENRMREACTRLGSITGMCVNPLTGFEAKNLPHNSYSHAWNIGRSLALARLQKKDLVNSLLQVVDGVLLFTGKITSVARTVTGGFSRGRVSLEETSLEAKPRSTSCLVVEFENENLTAVQKMVGKRDKVIACCPDLITFLDMANGAPIGISDYKYGLRVNVVALRAPPVWTTERGLELGGPRAFGLDMDYRGVSTKKYKDPKSVFEVFSAS